MTASESETSETKDAVVSLDTEGDALRARAVEWLCSEGDISNASTLQQSGIAEAELVISTVPDELLKKTSNAQIARMVRAMNPKAVIITHATRMDPSKLPSLATALEVTADGELALLVTSDAAADPPRLELHVLQPTGADVWSHDVDLGTLATVPIVTLGHLGIDGAGGITVAYNLVSDDTLSGVVAYCIGEATGPK